MNGLSLFTRTNAPRSINIASYHDPASLTWSWILNFSAFKPSEARLRPLFRAHYGGGGWTLRIPLIGFIHWHTQAKMMRDTLRASHPERR